MHAVLLATLLDTAAIDRAVRLVMRTQHVAGLSLGVARRGRPLYEHGYGIRDLGRRLPAQPETVYRIGSLTKAFTAAAVLKLRDRGRLSLDDPASSYIPQFPWRDEITLRELLEQRSGIPSYSDTALDPYAAYAPGELLAAVAAQPLAFTPGTQFQYSNTNYALLGMTIERASGAAYGAYLQTSILGPMRLQHTRYGDARGMARGYARDTLEMPVRPTSVSYAFAAAGMTSNVPDLLRFMAHETPPFYGTLANEMYGHAVRYATGNVNGYSAFALLSPERGDAIVILTNADRLDIFPLAQSVFAMLERPAPHSYAHGFGPPQNEDPRVTALVRAAVQERFPKLGMLTLLEFLESRTTSSGPVYTYRATFEHGVQLVLHARVAANGSVEFVTGPRP